MAVTCHPSIMAPQVPVHRSPKRRLLGVYVWLWVTIFTLLTSSVGPAADVGRAGLTEHERERALARIDSLWTAGEYDSARAAIAPLLTLADVSGDSLLWLGLLVRDGLQRVSFGDALGGEPVLREALGLAETLDDSTSLCSVLRWLGLAVSARGRGAEAIRYYERLLHLATVLADLSHEAWARIGLGWEARQAGRLDDAAQHHQRAATLFEETGEIEGSIWALNGRGLVLTDKGAYEEAAECYQQAVNNAGRVGFQLMEAAALNNLGSLEYNLGDPGAAEEHFERAYELQRALGHRSEAITPAANVALCQINLGRFLEADSLLAVCLGECEGLGYADLMGQVLSRLAMSCREQELYGEAADTYRRALALGDKLSLDVRMDCLLGLAYTLAAMDSVGAALAVLEEGANRLAGVPHTELRLRLELGIGQMLLAAGRHGEALDVLGRVERDAAEQGFSTQQLAALIAAARCHRALDQSTEVLAVLHRAKRVWEAERGLPLDPEWREQRGGLVKRLYTELGWNLLDDGSGGYADRVRQAFDTLQTFKARTLQERMRGPGKEAGWLNGTRPEELATLAVIQDSVLRPGEILLDAYLGPDVSLLFAVTPDTFTAVRLPAEKELNGILRFHYDVMSSPPEDLFDPGYREGIAALGQNVAQLLFGDVRDLVEESERVLLVPDGLLNLLPLSALPTGSERRGVDEMKAYVRIPSASILLNLRSEHGKTETHSEASVLAVAGGRTPDGHELEGAVREVESLNRHYERAEVLLLPSARMPLGPRELSAYDVLHFATHTRVNDQNPWQSAIQLDPGGEGTSLRAADIAAMRLPVDLVVLSSCASAAGRILSGEGVLGLSSAFISAGSPAVVATLWPVDDATTVGFMETFYAELAAQENVATALRRAQGRLRDDPATEHPFFWAGFILVGEGDVRVALKPREGRVGLLVIALLGLGGAAVLVIRLRRR